MVPGMNTKHVGRILGLFAALLTVPLGCSGESPGTDADVEVVAAELRDKSGNEVVVASADTLLKTSIADSSTLANSEKCAIKKGTKVSLKNPTVEGAHVTGLLMSAHGCAGKFGGGERVYVFRSDFGGWSPLPPAGANVAIVNRAENYAASCQYRAADRGPNEINRIVLHNTEGYFSSFKATWQACDRIGAAHYVVERNGTILRTIPDRDVAFHAIGANYDSIGIEIESGPGFEGITPEEEKSVIALTKRLQRMYGVSKSEVTMHRLAAPGTTDCASYIWPDDGVFVSWRDRSF
jgi:hypothetical protein